MLSDLFQRQAVESKDRGGESATSGLQFLQGSGAISSPAHCRSVARGGAMTTVERVAH